MPEPVLYVGLGPSVPAGTPGATRCSSCTNYFLGEHDLVRCYDRKVRSLHTKLRKARLGLEARSRVIKNAETVFHWFERVIGKPADSGVASGEAREHCWRCHRTVGHGYCLAVRLVGFSGVYVNMYVCPNCFRVVTQLLDAWRLPLETRDRWKTLAETLSQEGTDSPPFFPSPPLPDAEEDDE